MEIILTQDIKGLGYKNDTLPVKNGYGRNYLIPQGFAIIANDKNSKIVKENLKQAAHKAARVKADAEAVAAKIEGLKLEIKAKIGDSGKIFGAVTTLQISDTLKAKGIEIDRKKISIVGSVKEAGEYVAEIDIHKEVKTKVNFAVVGE